jgi:hypothetical protein
MGYVVIYDADALIVAVILPCDFEISFERESPVRGVPFSTISCTRTSNSANCVCRNTAPLMFSRYLLSKASLIFLSLVVLSMWSMLTTSQTYCVDCLSLFASCAIKSFVSFWTSGMAIASRSCTIALDCFSKTGFFSTIACPVGDL